MASGSGSDESDPGVSRRRFLKVTGAASVTAALSGCSGGDAGSNTTTPDGTDPPTDAPTTGNHTTPAPDTTTLDTPTPVPASRFEGVSVPGYFRRWDVSGEHSWFHEADEDTLVYVRPRTERATLPVTLDFTAVNESSETLEPGHWDFFKLHADRWFHIGPPRHNMVSKELPAQSTKSWEITVAHGPPPDESFPRSEFGHLGGGLYGVTVQWGIRTKWSGALVELVADPVEITPMDTVTTTSDGDRITVTSERWQEDPDVPSVELTVTRTENDGLTVIPEQVMQPRLRALRNSVPYLDEGFETVVLRTDSHASSDVIFEGDSRTFQIAGRESPILVENTFES